MCETLTLTLTLTRRIRSKSAFVLVGLPPPKWPGIFVIAGVSGGRRSGAWRHPAADDMSDGCDERPGR